MESVDTSKSAAAVDRGEYVVMATNDIATSGDVGTATEFVPTAKKPSEIAQHGVLGDDHRETGRPTDVYDMNIQMKSGKSRQPVTVCCCIQPFIEEEIVPYFPGFNVREGDVYKHRATVKKEVICFNLCFITETGVKTSYQNAVDGTLLVGFNKEELNDIRKYFLMKTERCSNQHHDLKRFSIHGRILTYLCTAEGLLSTCKKVCCITNCVDEIDVKTVRCEKSLYRKH